jgi:G3E family GTPase
MPDEAAMRRALESIPFLVLTGFLGAGKTTRLNRWLKAPGWADTLVIINEYGEAGLDHLLIEEATSEIVLLPAGCACCTLRGDLVMTLEDLLRRRDNNRMPFFRRVVLETTGLADPLPVYHALLQHPYFSKRFRLDGTITLIDALNGTQTLTNHMEARRQVALADWLLLTKAEDADKNAIAALKVDVAALNPSALWVEDAQEPAAFMQPRFDAARLEDGAIEGWLGDALVSHQTGGITSFSFTSDEPITQSALMVFLAAMRMMHGPKLLRMKAILHMVEEPEKPLILHAVQSAVSEPVRLMRWPTARRRSRLVMITDGIAQEVIEGFWRALVKG